MIRFTNVSKRYPGGHTGLSNVSFHIEPEEMVFLTGHSGAGKSTLLRLIGLLERCTRGQVRINGRNLGRLPARQIPYHRREVGMIFQDHRLLHDRTVFDNVALPLVVAGLGHKEVGRRVRAALDKVDLLNKEKALPITLSGGEQQRVGIARAVVSRPPLVLADEPTGNLDPELSREIMQLFRQFNQVGVTLLIATHDIGLISTLGQRTLTLDHGRVGQGSQHIKNRPNAHFLSGSGGNLHGAVIQRRKEKPDIDVADPFRNHFRVKIQVDTQGFQKIGTPAPAGHGTITVLRHRDPTAGHHKSGRGGNIESIARVTAGSAGNNNRETSDIYEHRMPPH